MNTRSLERRSRVLSDKLQPRQRLIHCAGAKEELLAMLEYQIEQEGGDLSAPVEWNEDQLELCRKLSDLLEQDCLYVEEHYNVRFVE